jgi:hypothetical protein
MTYIIESGIPLPRAAGGNHKRASRPRGRTAPLSVAMDAMEVGQSFMVDTFEEHQRLLGRLGQFKPRTFAVRKIVGQGWRIWRTE